jgi:hypothetical protein
MYRQIFISTDVNREENRKKREEMLKKYSFSRGDYKFDRDESKRL